MREVLEKKRAVFFDRDNTLIKNVPYLGDPAKVEIFPGAIEIVKHLKNAGYLLFIVSNQSGVGRGYITKDQVDLVTGEMVRQLGGEPEALFTELLYCYVSPKDPDRKHYGGAKERKPSPEMLLDAQKRYNIDLSRSFMVGDRMADVGCGNHAGAWSVLVTTGDDPSETEEAKAFADYVAADLPSVEKWILDMGSEAKMKEGADE